MVVRKLLFVLFLLFVVVTNIRSQCTTLGQTPVTAFPVCGSSVFKQTSVPPCVNGNVPAPCPANGNVYQDLNPYWYKFTCFASGTLKLTITPNNLADDYDWQIFDVTGRNPNDVYTDISLIVACNWSGLTGVTGTASNAASLTECGSTNTSNPPIFSKLPQLIQGHNYLLLISHFSGNSQSGYSLSFDGGTASITDPTPPKLKSATPICDGSRLKVVLNKKMKCASLATDGSDFTVSSATGATWTVTGASAVCSSGFDMDTLFLTLDRAIPQGNNIAVTAKTGSDGNTLLDNCDAQVPVGQVVSFIMPPLLPTPLDSITRPGCAPDVLQLVFKNKIICSSIAANGSDFTVTGPVPVQVIGATALCNDATGEASIVQVKLSAPLVTGGDYQIRLDNGSDNNTIIDECGLLIPSNQTLTFHISDTVSAVFDERLLLGCKQDTILYDYSTKNGVNSWLWVFDNKDTVRQQHPPRRIYSEADFGNKTALLIVSNGVCTDTTQVATLLDNDIHAKFEGPVLLCPKDFAQFHNNSTGKNITWDWDFGDGTGSSLQTPPDHLFPPTGVETKYTVRLVISNGACFDTALQQIDVLKSCYIAVPSAFTPNGDGLNDYLYPLNALKADNLIFRVYNRYGQLVFETNDWTRRWDGTVNGHPVPAGTFVWTLQYTDHDSGKKFFQRGTTVLIR